MNRQEKIVDLSSRTSRLDAVRTGLRDRDSLGQ